MLSGNATSYEQNLRKSGLPLIPLRIELVGTKGTTGNQRFIDHLVKRHMTDNIAIEWLIILKYVNKTIWR